MLQCSCRFLPEVLTKWCRNLTDYEEKTLLQNAKKKSEEHREKKMTGARIELDFSWILVGFQLDVR